MFLFDLYDSAEDGDGDGDGGDGGVAAKKVVTEIFHQVLHSSADAFALNKRGCARRRRISLLRLNERSWTACQVGQGSLFVVPSFRFL